MKYSNLELIILRENQRGLHGGYKYLIHCHCTAHTAFRTKNEVKTWLSERGLTVGKRFGWGISCHINGSYIDNCMMISRKQFGSMFNGLKPIRQLSNGDYTTAYITTEYGIRVINYLNPNCDRDILIYQNN